MYHDNFKPIICFFVAGMLRSTYGYVHATPKDSAWSTMCVKYSCS